MAVKLKLVGGKYISSKAKVGAECSKAMSDWKSGRSTAKGVGKILGKCRAQAHALKTGGIHRAKGQELKAQALEHRAATGKVGVKARAAQAREKVQARQKVHEVAKKKRIAGIGILRQVANIKRISKQEAEAKKNLAGSLFDPAKLKLAPTSRQPIARTAGYKALAEEGKEANEYLTSLVNRGKGIGAELGLPTIKAEDITPGKEEETIAKYPNGLVMLAPIKGEKRATQKVNDWFNGDWRKLNDIARATIAVKSMDQVKTIIKKLHERGVTFASPPKDRISKPTDAGYRDVVMSLRSPSGVVGELQIHLTPILRAKAEGHKDFETVRTIEGELARTGRKATPQEEAAFTAAMTRMKSLYGLRWKKLLRLALEPP